MIYFLSPTKPNADGSRFFGSPTKLFEYMSLGKPVIVSDLEQLAEVVAPAIKTGQRCDVVANQVGLTVPPGDVAGFVGAVHAMVNADEASREKLGANARAKVLREYTWQKYVERIMEFSSCK